MDLQAMLRCSHEAKFSVHVRSNCGGSMAANAVLHSPSDHNSAIKLLQIRLGSV
jgi:hypothetical protein